MPDMEADDRGKNDDYYLELSPDPIRFESVSCLTNVFFDDSKQQVSRLCTRDAPRLSARYNNKRDLTCTGIRCPLGRCYRSAR